MNGYKPPPIGGTQSNPITYNKQHSYNHANPITNHRRSNRGATTAHNQHLPNRSSSDIYNQPYTQNRVPPPPPPRFPFQSHSSRSLIPTNSSRSPIPPNSHRSPIPSHSSRSPIPSRSNRSLIPSTSSRSPIPSTSNRSLIPSTSSRSPIPSNSNRSPIPSNSNRSPIPSTSNRSPIPSKSSPITVPKNKRKHISSKTFTTSSSYTSYTSIANKSNNNSTNNINPLYSLNTPHTPLSVHSVQSQSHSADYDSDTYAFLDESCRSLNTPSIWNENKEWIECSERDSGKPIWYNTETLLVSFDNPFSETKSDEYNAYADDELEEDDLFTKPIARTDIAEADMAQFILKFAQSEWDFTNDYVDVYRSQTAAIDHKLLCPHPNDLVFPEFFSNHTIPKNHDTFVATILPPIEFNMNSTSWKMAINIGETTASDIILKFIAKMQYNDHEASSNRLIPEHFVLKVIGNEEYILFDDNKLIIDYEAVRRAVRNEDSVRFGLVHRPDLNEIIAEARDLQEDYKETFASKYPLFVRDSAFLKYEAYGVGDGKSMIEIKLLEFEAQKERKKQSSFYGNFIGTNRAHHRLSVTEQEEEESRARGSLRDENISPFGFEASLADSRWLRQEIQDRQSMGDLSAILLSDHNEFYSFRIHSLFNVTKLARFIASRDSIRRVIVRHELWIGPQSYSSLRYTTPNIARVSDHMQFADWFESSTIKYCDLPREATLSLTIYGLSPGPQKKHSDKSSKGKKKKEKKKKKVVETPLGFVRIPIIDHRHRLMCGKYTFNVWPIPVFVDRKHGLKSDPYGHGHEFRFRGTTRDRCVKIRNSDSAADSNRDSDSILDHFNKPTHDICQISIEFGAIPHPRHDVVAPLLNGYSADEEFETETITLTDIDWRHIHNIITRDLVAPISADDRRLMWIARGDLVSMPSALPTFLKCVDFCCSRSRRETYFYLSCWCAPAYLEDALELLSWHYADNRVREYGVMCIASMHDSDLQRYLLQLIECLKFELHHSNALIRLLMRRGLMNPYQIGHFLFWGLYAEYQNSEGLYAERFGLYLEEYLLHSTSHCCELLQQINLVKHLKYINHEIYKKSKDKRRKTNRRELLRELHSFCESLNSLLPSIISLPLNPRWRCTHLLVSKCAFFSSAQVPLLLVFGNVDPLAEDISVLFKCGDDLRQDILTLQVFRVMDKVWLDRGLNLRLITYDVVATGMNSGMLEIVSESTTTNDIHLSQQQSAQKGCRDESTHAKYIEKYNKSEEELRIARKNYARSVAGYCVATYVTGIGDRHPDNIMLRQNGVLFHIDFGHFLGNFKVKKVVANYKWKRERTPFVFLPAMKHAMGNELYQSFEQWFCDAYMALRIRHRLLFNLFILMIPSKMPELICLKDLTYLRDQLHLKDIPQDQISKHCKKIIKLCLNDKSRILDNIFHAVKHAN